jgi:hypothetical protein
LSPRTQKDGAKPHHGFALAASSAVAPYGKALETSYLCAMYAAKKPRLRIFPYQWTPGAPSFALFAKGGIPRISIPTVAYPTLCKEREGWGTRPFVVLSAVPNTNSPKDASRPHGVSRAERWQVERSGIPHLAQSARSDMGHPGSIYAGEIRRKVFSHLLGDFADLTHGMV